MSEEKIKMAEEIMKESEQKLNEVKDINEDWGGTVQVVFTDIQIGYRMKFDMDGTVHIEKKPASEIKEEDADATSYTDVQTMRGIMDKKVDAMEAMSQRKFRSTGKSAAFMKIAPAFM